MTMLNKLNDLNLTVLMRSRQHLMTAIALGVTAVLLFGLSFGQVSDMLATREKLASEQKKIDQLNVKAQNLEQLKTSPEFAQADRINEVLPSRKPLLELLNNLNNVANETRVAITEFEISPGEIASDSANVSAAEAAKNSRRTADYDKLDLELTIVGDLGQVRQFMDLIERVSPITTITQLTIDRKVQSTLGLGENATRADLALSTYYYTRSIASTVSSPLPDISSRQQEIFQEILSFSPAEIETQTTIISGNSSDLFGIPGLTVTSLEETLNEEATSSASN